MEEVKAFLYCYPKMEQMEGNYEEHIKNKAYTSFKIAAERIAEEIAEEILKKSLLKDLKRRMDKVIERLTEQEKYLLELRYFRRKKALAEYEEKYGKDFFGSVRNYFRRQAALLKKTEILMERYGLGKEKREKYFRLEELEAALSYIRAGKAKASPGERSLVRLLSDGK